jgi:hypothetical protein
LTPRQCNEDLSERLAFLGLDASVRTDARQVWQVIRDDFDGVLERFYAQVGTLGFAIGASDVATLKRKQRKHWENLFRAEFDDEYATVVRRSGITHHNIGLTPTDFLAGYAFITDSIVAIIDRRLPDDRAMALRLIRTVLKLTAIDAGIALCVYNSVILE